MLDRSLTFLIVEGDQADAEALVKHLEADSRYSHRFLVAESGKRGIELSVQDNCDILFLGGNLPDMDETDFLDMLKACHSDLHPPVILLSGNENRNPAAEVLKPGLHDCIFKNDLSPNRLFPSISYTLRIHQEKTRRIRAELELKKAKDELEARVDQRTRQIFLACEQLKNEMKERKKAEEELRKKEIDQAMAEAANRMKDEFLSTVSHELRTPLSGIIGYAQTLQRMADRGKLTPRKQSDFIYNILESANHLADMLSDLLDLAKIETGKLEVRIEPVSLHMIIDSVISNLKQHASDKGLEFRYFIPENYPKVMADRTRLMQVMFNLVGNAIKYTDKGSVIVEADVRDHDSAVISVIDTGPGVSAEYIPHLFDSFSRSEVTRYKPGSGLGLAITRKLIELMNGEIHVKSQVGQGSTFYFNLPLADELFEKPGSRFSGRRPEEGARE